MDHVANMAYHHSANIFDWKYHLIISRPEFPWDKSSNLVCLSNWLLVNYTSMLMFMPHLCFHWYIVWYVPIKVLISDAFVIWRASVLFTSNRWVMTIPLLFLLATTGNIIIMLDWTANTQFLLFLGVYITNTSIPAANLSAAASILSWTQVAISLATNLTTTGLIGWCLWYVIIELGCKFHWLKVI